MGNRVARLGAYSPPNLPALCICAGGLAAPCEPRQGCLGALRQVFKGRALEETSSKGNEPERGDSDTRRESIESLSVPAILPDTPWSSSGGFPRAKP